MVKNKVALISSVFVLGICLVLTFLIPKNEVVREQFSFMSFPVYTNDEFVPLGVIGSVLFVFAMVLLVKGVKKYYKRTVIIVTIVYLLLPSLMTIAYRETFAKGIAAVSYDGEGTCELEYKKKDVLDGECKLRLFNRSNETVSFELEFVDTIHREGDAPTVSLMNGGGPYHITIKPNTKEFIDIKESIDVSDVPKEFDWAQENYVRIKLIDGENTRIVN